MIIEKLKLEFKNSLKHRNNIANTRNIILHHAGNMELDITDIHELHKLKGKDGIGYHYVITSDGDIYQTREDIYVGSHCFDYPNSIGILFLGDFNIIEEMPEHQLKASKELLSYLKQKYPTSRVLFHRDKFKTDCPGKYFPEELKNV